MLSSEAARIRLSLPGLRTWLSRSSVTAKVASEARTVKGLSRHKPTSLSHNPFIPRSLQRGFGALEDSPQLNNNAIRLWLAPCLNGVSSAYFFALGVGRDERLFNIIAL
jgi:hypothetical protein